MKEKSKKFLAAILITVAENGDVNVIDILKGDSEIRDTDNDSSDDIDQDEDNEDDIDEEDWDDDSVGFRLCDVGFSTAFQNNHSHEDKWSAIMSWFSDLNPIRRWKLAETNVFFLNDIDDATEAFGKETD